LVEQARFRAAFDFLRLRADVAEVDLALADWWQEFSMADDATREDLVLQAKAERPKPVARRAPRPEGEAAPKPRAPARKADGAQESAPDHKPAHAQETDPEGEPSDPGKKRRRRRRKAGGAEGSASASVGQD
jgi:poly(A) polymerase